VLNNWRRRLLTQRADHWQTERFADDDTEFE
jgi:hypothetical protein